MIYVDDEPLAICRFEAIAKTLTGIKSLHCFSTSAAAELYADTAKIDLAFLDIDMPEKDGLALAESLWRRDRSIRVVFVTAHAAYALPAYEVGALGYVVKPYSAERIQTELQRASRVRDIPVHEVYIQTMPRFDVFVDGLIFRELIGKPKELLALLVDRNGRAVPPGEAIACLWEKRPCDENAAALLRMTMKRLRDTLKAGGILSILGQNNQRAVDVSMFRCDYCELLGGGGDFGGEYMSEYAWAETTVARLERLYGRGGAPRPGREP